MGKIILIDGQSHLAGRLASICAKELLNGSKIIIVKSEKIEISGKHIKNKNNMLKKNKKKNKYKPKKRSIPFPLSFANFLENRKRYATAQNQKRNKCFDESKNFRGYPKTI